MEYCKDCGVRLDCDITGINPIYAAIDTNPIIIGYMCDDCYSCMFIKERDSNKKSTKIDNAI
jgi:hypothetical protein